MFWSGLSYVLPQILLAAMFVCFVVHLHHWHVSTSLLYSWVMGFGVRRWSCKVHSGRVLKVQVFYNVYIPRKSTTIRKIRWFLLDDEPLQKSWWFGNQAIGNCGWTSRVYVGGDKNLNWVVANKRVFTHVKRLCRPSLKPKHSAKKIAFIQIFFAKNTQPQSSLLLVIKCPADRSTWQL